jgi:hypothetical protein
MKSFLLLAVSVFVSLFCFPQSGAPSKEIQIKSALLAAPADKRDSASVYGYSDKKEFILLKKGTNELVCLADDPGKAGFSVSCYHKDLQPFMQRGQELRNQGKGSDVIFDTREKEVKSGKLKMPKQPTTLFVYTSKDENYNYLRYVVYIPYATAESTGLPLKPDGPAMPWIMHPGTHGAHIMINPPQTAK